MDRKEIVISNVTCSEQVQILTLLSKQILFYSKKFITIRLVL